MSWTRIFIHVVFTTKNRFPFLRTRALRNTLFKHIVVNAQSKQIHIDCIGGYHDHVHCLLHLARNQSVSQVVQIIKGESSRWINQQRLTTSKFCWQDDYWAVSLGSEHLERLRNYIFNQEVHHRHLSFQEELDQFPG